jgi:hypothetical protein
VQWRRCTAAGPIAGDLFSCQGAISARRTRPFGQIKSSHSRGSGGPTPSSARWAAARLSVPALWVVSSSSIRIRRSKKPLPFGSGSNGQGPVKVQFIPSSTPP